MFKRLGEIDIPLDEIAEFGRKGPLLVEIGFGNGSFLEHVASARPDANCLGAELSLSSLNRAHRRIRNRGLTNIRLLKCDGKFLLRNVVAESEVERISVNFPDPWPRQRHRKKRLLSDEFFTLAASRLTAGGVVALATDDEPYLEYARRQADVTGLYDERVVDVPEECLRTRYARKWLDENRPIHYVEFISRRRVNGIFRTLALNDMHHAFLKGELPGQLFEPKHLERTGSAEIVVVDVLRSDTTPGFVLAVTIEEEGLRQDVLIEVRPHRDGYHVGLRRFASPVLTDGVAAAVRMVAARLESLGMEIVDTWY